ncbi:5-formyltetrahydrofolate cyclo-ligase [Argonema antarcticum]|uniref:5-formyltetrahydrofolate cyclo-ligase n=1 Tax=Argonema antarcticum TaxID=2942763 RepID=UPI00201182B3|nr:5-formyltetrahydrofolate cyclo-ligase [Argonema antarcticum]MCL1471426.1 5-formyltetrahydrofolate cyclo-ligase [Argonema antarcticum A004/B2]
MDEVNNQVNKAELRRTILQKRKSMPVEEWREKCDRICTHLQSSPLFTQAQTILAYFSFRQEPDLGQLVDNKRRWGFPRCEGNSMNWHIWKPGEPLRKGDHGIFEPNLDLPTLNVNEVDLILVPSVACDGRGYRLGYGGGYYDRLLSSPEWASKPTIGIVFEFAYLPQLPIQEWDIQLNGVCTEMGLRMRR